MGRRAVELLRDAPRWQAMRAACIARAQLYSVDTVVPQYEQFYEETLG